MYLVVAYDVVSDRRRARLARKLLDFLPRLQKSVFEGELPERRLPALMRVIAANVALEEDSVRVYHLCSGCRRQVEGIGATRASAVDSEDAFDEILDN